MVIKFSAVVPDAFIASQKIFCDGIIAMYNSYAYANLFMIHDIQSSVGNQRPCNALRNCFDNLIHYQVCNDLYNFILNVTAKKCEE